MLKTSLYSGTELSRLQPQKKQPAGRGDVSTIITNFEIKIDDTPFAF